MQNPLESFSYSDPFLTWWPFVIAILVGVLTTFRSYIAGPTCPSSVSLYGKTIVITGGSSGIGLEVLMDLLKRNARVYLATRNKAKTKDIISKEVRNKRITSESQLKIIQLDLASSTSVKKFVKSLDATKIDVLINNAGIAFQPFSTNEDGIESHFAVNYLGHFLLTYLLLPKLKRSDGGRVVTVSAPAHNNGVLTMPEIDYLRTDKDYDSIAAFARSKLALVLMTRYLSSKWLKENVTVNAVDPGRVRGTGHVPNDNISKSLRFRIMSWLLMKTPKQAAQTIIYAVVAPELKTVTGRYFCNCSETPPSEKALDMGLARELYKKSLEMSGIASDH